MMRSDRPRRVKMTLCMCNGSLSPPGGVVRLRTTSCEFLGSQRAVALPFSCGSASTSTARYRSAFGAETNGTPSIYLFVHS